MNTNNGKLIVIEGTDGSGKKTQADLLFKYFQENDHLVKKVHFPRYKDFYGQLCARLLNGEFGDYKTVDPYFYTLMLAMDRWQAKADLDAWLKSGNTVISDRYVYSLAHQVARLPEEKQDEYIEWFLEMEFEINQLPREDVVIFLHVPTDFSVELVKTKSEREYLQGKAADIAESDFEHQYKSEQAYLDFVERFDNWEVVSCVKDDTLRSIEEIHVEIKDRLRNHGLLGS